MSRRVIRQRLADDRLDPNRTVAIMGIPLASHVEVIKLARTVGPCQCQKLVAQASRSKSPKSILRGFMFVTYASSDVALAACDRLNNQVLKDGSTRLSVQMKRGSDFDVPTRSHAAHATAGASAAAAAASTRSAHAPPVASQGPVVKTCSTPLGTSAEEEKERIDDDQGDDVDQGDDDDAAAPAAGQPHHPPMPGAPPTPIGYSAIGRLPYAAEVMLAHLNPREAYALLCHMDFLAERLAERVRAPPPAAPSYYSLF